MRSGGLFALLRAFLADALRGLGLRLSSICAALADRLDPVPPSSIDLPPEWHPRLWARTGGRTANESQD